MAFQKGFDPNRNYGGRPKGSNNKKLTKSEMEVLNDLLGKLTGEAVDLIVESMRDNSLPMKERVASAKIIISTKVQTDQIVDRRKNGQEEEDDEESESGSVINIVWNKDFEKKDSAEKQN